MDGFGTSFSEPEFGIKRKPVPNLLVTNYYKTPNFYYFYSFIHDFILTLMFVGLTK